MKIFNLLRIVLILAVVFVTVGCVTANSETVKEMGDGFICELLGPMWMSTPSEKNALYIETENRGLICANGYIAGYKKSKESSEPDYYKILNDNTLQAADSIGSESLSYNDSTRSGVITLSTNLKGRDDALMIIGDICSTKNISLRSGNAPTKNGATYTVTDETLTSNVLTIKFNCIY